MMKVSASGSADDHLGKFTSMKTVCAHLRQNFRNMIVNHNSTAGHAAVMSRAASN